MNQEHDVAQSLDAEAQQAQEQMARRDLLVKGAAATVGITAGIFMPPRLTSLNLHASPAAAASPLPE